MTAAMLVVPQSGILLLLISATSLVKCGEEDDGVSITQTISVTTALDGRLLINLFEANTHNHPKGNCGVNDHLHGPPPPPATYETPPLPGEDLAAGGQMGDRCPITLKDENGRFPNFCYDVIDDHGNCIMDDMIIDREQCIDGFGQEFYDKQVALQAEMERNRTAALGATMYETSEASNEGQQGGLIMQGQWRHGGDTAPPNTYETPPLPGEDQTGGGQMGDRCPNTLKDENGSFPNFCYDVIDEHGNCIMDDMILDREQCIDGFGQEFYDKQVALQAENERNRTAVQEAATDETPEASNEGHQGGQIQGQEDHGGDSVANFPPWVPAEAPIPFGKSRAQHVDKTRALDTVSSGVVKHAVQFSKLAELLKREDGPPPPIGLE